MAMTLNTNGGAKADINMTPMIDVLLTLIIIFMVITPTASRGMDALVPQPSVGAGDNLEALVITVRAGGELTLNRQPITLDELRGKLIELRGLAPSRVVFVRGETGIEFARVAEAIDAARGAGIRRVALMTE